MLYSIHTLHTDTYKDTVTSHSVTSKRILYTIYTELCLRYNNHYT